MSRVVMLFIHVSDTRLNVHGVRFKSSIVPSNFNWSGSPHALRLDSSLISTSCERAVGGEG